MRLQEKQITAEVQGEQSGNQFGISVGDQSHIMAILRDKLYSDKIMAILREYGTNALDAHMESGQGDRPVLIRLPTRFNLQFAVRDYGAGLSEKDVYSIYTQYGRSTKRQSNNAIGQLGLGCKSAFAYSQQFTVTSWHGGKKMIFNAFIDPSNEGRMTKLFEADCSADETGVEVAIPANADDVQQFEQKAHKCYYYFEPQPEINIELRNPEYTMQRGWWRIKTHFDSDQNTPVAVMGSIGYPIRSDRIPNLSAEETALLNTPLEIRFPIGELSIGASREDLEYTDHTVGSIRQRLQAINKMLKEEIQARFATATSYWEARKLYWQFVEIAQQSAPDNWARRKSHNFIQSLVNKYSAWHGFPLTTTTWRQSGACTHGEVKQLPSRYERFPTGSYDQGRIEVSPTTVLYIADTKSAYLQRILQNRKGHCLVYVPNDKNNVQISDLNTWLKAHGLTGIPTYFLSTLPYDAKLNTVGRSVVVASKAKEKVFELKNGFSPTAHPKSSNWNPSTADLKDGKGVYVGLYSYVPENKQYEQINLRTIRNQIQALKILNGSGWVPPAIIGVKRKHHDKVGPGWQLWDEWYKVERAKALTKLNLTQEARDYAALSSRKAKRLYEMCEKPAVAQLVAKLDPNSDVVSFVNRIADAVKLLAKLESNKALLQELTQDIDSTVRPTVDPGKEMNLIQNKYPMLSQTGFWQAYSANESLIEECAQYVKIVDAYNKSQKEES